jgi:proteasome lid subunit RPN8/RPN11
MNPTLRITAVLMRLLMSRTHLGKVEFDARARAPVEACGILIGKHASGNFEVVDVVKASNMANSSTRFEINPEELYQTIKDAEAKGLEVLGFYHSHLGYGAGPSVVDLDRMKLFLDIVWLICDISDEGAEFKAFMLHGEKLVELEII